MFSENDLLKVDKILGLTFFKARKDFEGFKKDFREEHDSSEFFLLLAIETDM